MFGWIKAIFSTPRALASGLNMIDKGVEGIGKLVFTDQEKAELSAKTYETWLEVQKVIADENSIRSITRRILAVSIMSTFLFLLIMAAFTWPWMPAWSAYLLLLVKSLSNLVLAVAVFYFGYYGVAKVINGSGKKT